MKIATWNVNSVRARLKVLDSWLSTARPDVLLLQEIKCLESAFPYSFFDERGYACQVLGQKSYNGVAVVSRLSMEDRVAGLPTFPEDPSARYLEILVGGRVRVASLYVPNGGQDIGGAPYNYKLTFLERLQDYLKKLGSYNEAIFIGGDFNIAPTDDDVYDETIWHDRVCCTEAERAALQKMHQNGWRDLLGEAWEATHPSTKKPFTWWDYRTQAYSRNRGLRLDLFLGNTLAREYCQSIHVDAKTRGLPTPSDHAPVVLDIAEVM